MLLPECETHLVVLVVVRLAVKPLNGCVHVIPLPLSRLVLAVPTRGASTKPEGGVLTRRNCRKETSLQPVVDPRVIKLGNPRSGVSSADEVGRRPHHGLGLPDQEATAPASVLLFFPAIRAAVGVLSGSKAKPDRNEE